MHFASVWKMTLSWSHSCCCLLFYYLNVYSNLTIPADARVLYGIMLIRNNKFIIYSPNNNKLSFIWHEFTTSWRKAARNSYEQESSSQEKKPMLSHILSVSNCSLMPFQTTSHELTLCLLPRRTKIFTHWKCVTPQWIYHFV